MIRRIQERAAFVRLGRDGTRIRAASLWCTYSPDPTVMPPRVAFAVGRAVGPAVVRNRLRRRLRAILRDLAASDRMPPGWYLIGARPSAVELTYDQLRSEMTGLLTTLATRRPS